MSRIPFLESLNKLPESPDIVPTPCPFLLDDVWSVEEWRLGPCKLFLTGKNGVSDEVYCNVLLKFSKVKQTNEHHDVEI